MLFANNDLDKLLKQVSKYDYGDSCECLADLNEKVVESLNSIDTQKIVEQQLINVLKSNATFAAKQFICKELSLIGSENSVSALIKMLENERTLNIALFALQRIHAENVNEQLRFALNAVKDANRIAIINTLGERKDKQAISLLEKGLYSSDPEFAIASAEALGKISGDEAVTVLKSAIAKTSHDVLLAVLDSYLYCADQYKSELSKALSIYKDVFTSTHAPPLRSAALTGIVRISKSQSIETLLKTIREEDFALQSTAISLIRELPEGSNLNSLILEFQGLSPILKIQFLAALTYRNEAAGRELALQVIKDENMALRIAALRSLAILGNENDVLLLAGIAAKSKAAEKESTRQSLSQLKGQDIDKIILSKIPDSDTAVKAELIHSIGSRNIQNAIDLLFATIQDTQRIVRKESYESLSIVAGKNDFNKIIDLLVNPKYSDNLQNSKSLVAKVALKDTEGDITVNVIADKLSKVNNFEIKATLLNILGKTGNKKALYILRTNLADNDENVKNAAIKAFTFWPNTEPLNDLLAIVREVDSSVDKLTALRGYIRLIMVDENLAAEKKVNLYKNAMAYSEKINEQQMIINGLAKIETISAMDILISYLDRAALKLEVQKALLEIAPAVAEIDLKKTRAVLSQIINDSLSDQQRETAKTILSRINDI